MPELPEVETVRRTLERQVVGRTIHATEIYETRMRYPVAAERVRNGSAGATIRAIRRRAKYLLLDLSNHHTLMLHLGMSGRLEVVAAEASRVVHDHLELRLDDARALRLNDPRRFGSVDVFVTADEARHPRLAHLGVEPLSAAFSSEYMHRAASNSKRPVKNFIMDGTKVVGVGNIYASEALFLAGIHPRRAAGRISVRRWEALVRAIRQVLRDAIESGGTTLRDFVDASGAAGAYGGRLRVYGREAQPCPNRDGGVVRRMVMVGRSTYYCAKCQR